MLKPIKQLILGILIFVCNQAIASSIPTWCSDGSTEVDYSAINSPANFSFAQAEEDYNQGAMIDSLIKFRAVALVSNDSAAAYNTAFVAETELFDKDMYASDWHIDLCRELNKNTRLAEAYDAFSEDSASGDKRAQELLTPLTQQNDLWAIYFLARMYTVEMTHRDDLVNDKLEGMRLFNNYFSMGGKYGQSTYALHNPFYFHNKCLTPEQKEDHRFFNLDDVIKNRHLYVQFSPQCSEAMELIIEFKEKYLEPTSSFCEASDEECLLTRALQGESEARNFCSYARYWYEKSGRLGHKPALDQALYLYMNKDQRANLFEVNSCKSKDLKKAIELSIVGTELYPQDPSYFENAGLNIINSSYNFHTKTFNDETRGSKYLYEAVKLYLEQGNTDAALGLYDSMRNAGLDNIFFDQVKTLIMSKM